MKIIRVAVSVLLLTIIVVLVGQAVGAWDLVKMTTGVSQRDAMSDR